MSHDDSLTRRTFLRRIGATGAVLSTGVFGVIGCDRGSNRDGAGQTGSSSKTSAQQAEKEANSPGQQEDSDSSPSDSQIDLVTQRLEAELDLLKKFTEINYDEVNGDLWKTAIEKTVPGVPDRLHWLFSPSGNGLGITFFGQGGKFPETAIDVADHMLVPKAADVFQKWSDELGGGVSRHLETMLGRPSWFRAGFEMSGFEKLRELLELEGVEVPSGASKQIDTLAGMEGAEAAEIDVAMSMAFDEKTRIVVGVALDEGAAIIPDHAPGAVVCYQVLGNPSVTWFRADGLADRELIDWQTARGLGKDAGGRIGEVQGALEMEKPAAMTWQKGKPANSLTYRYEKSIDYG